jgi:hypothetical protein
VVAQTSNGGQSVSWAPGESVLRRPDLYPQSLPYTDASRFTLAMCDIGLGGDGIRAGRYALLWDGEGAVDVATGSSVSCARRGLNNSADVVVSGVAPLSLSLTVRIKSSKAQNPVRNVRLVPATYEHNYTQQVFQPAFLALIQPFEHLRFTGWQKISNSAKNWTLRTLPSFQSQHAPGGVAAEHIVDLLLASNIRSMSLSFPLASPAYNTHLIDFLARHLPSDTVIYFEAGCPEFQGDTDRAAETIALADRFDLVFGNIGSLRDDVFFDWRPFASVTIPAYIPYLINWFGSGISRLHTVALAAHFGRSTFAWDGFTPHGIWRLGYAGMAVPELLDVLQSSLFVAEVDTNRMIQRLRGAHSSLNIIAYAAGPYFIANNYGYRAGKYYVLDCASRSAFPCVWANTQYHFENQGEVDSALAMMQWNATQEQLLEDKLIEAQRSVRIYDMYLDFLRRWELIGGGLLIGSNLIQPVTKCPTGGKGCGNDGIFESPPLNFSSCGKSCAKYSALIDYKKGVRSALAFTSADLAAPPDHHACAAPCQWGSCQLGECVCFAGYSGANCSAAAPKRPDCNSDTGINLAGVVDWSPEWVYLDVFKGGRAWISQDFFPGTEWSTATQQALSADYADYPSSLAANQKLGSLMVRDLHEHVPGGVYVVTYDGDGVLTFSMDVVAEKRGVGRVEVTVVPSSGLNNGLFLIIERTNPADPIRNIRVLMPGYEHWPLPFHPLYLDSLKNYKVLRMMDLANTNGAEYSRWADRATRNGTRSYSGASLMPGSADKGGVGVPVEDMVLLANLVGAAPWFNMPHLADDDFVRRFAELVKAQLRPDVRVYVEYSNEAWGTLFNGGKYAQEQGLALGLAGNDADARFCFYVMRSSEMFTIWKNVFGSQASRLEFVYASQSVNADVTKRMLRCSVQVNVQTNATAIAVAPYFGSYHHDTDTDIDIFMNTTLPAQIQGLAPMLREHAAAAAAFGMALLTYEAGQGLLGAGSEADRAIVANRDPRMSQLYVDYFDMLRSVGISLMMQYSSVAQFSTKMCFGLMEASDQDPKNSPKYIGLQAYIDKHSTCDLSAFDDKNSSSSSSACSFSGLYVDLSESCECYYGSSGDSCENNTYTEHTDLCGYYCNFYQGVCLPDRIVGAERYWACSCNEGYYGHQCSLSDCRDECNYNGQCIDKDICSCFAGFSGEFCETDCGCGGNGVCVGVGGCVCDYGFSWSVGAGTGAGAEAGAGTCVADADGEAGGEGTCGGAPCTSGVCIDGLCTCFAGYAGPSCDVSTGSKANQHSQVGVNLNGISYYSTELAFVDAMKMSSDWFSLDYPGLVPQTSTSWGNGKAVHRRPDGYPAYLEPGQILAKLMLRDVHLHAPAGRYVCLWDGDGAIDFGFDAATVAVGKNRVEFMFAPSMRAGCTAAYCGDNGILLKIMDTNRSNPIHNVRVIMPGFEAVYDKVPFHPLFLQATEPFSVIRFMDWQHANGNADELWAGRSLPSHDTQARASGVALEHMLALANVVGAAPWFCMPYRAGDDYVRHFATLVRDTLRTDVDVYVEYSNEVWNGLFPQAKYASERGLHLNLSTSEHTARYRYYSQRSVEIFAIWEEVFGASSPRLRKVLSTFTVSASATREILSWGNASQHATYVGVAPYFDCDNIGGQSKAGYTAILSVDALLDECNASWAYLTGYLGAAKAAAAEHGLPLITYEAGPSLVETAVIQYGAGGTAGLADLFIAANRHPRMQGLYRAYMQVLGEMGVFDGARPLMSFASCGTPSKYGSWGSIEYTGQPLADAPKYRALSEYFFPASEPCALCTPNSVSLHSYLQQAATAASASAAAAATAPAAPRYTYAGPPAVLAPRYNDVWVSGRAYEIQWALDTLETGLDLIIHRIDGAGSSATATSTVFWELGQSMDASLGRRTVTVPPALLFDGRLHFFAELRGAAGSNYSDVFSIQSQYYFDNTTYVCCAGDLIPSFDGCLHSNTTSHSNARYHNSSWAAVNASTIGTDCASPFPGWVISYCKTDAFGCRDFRTTRSPGNAYGIFKPVRDCTARTSPFPRPGADGGASVASEGGSAGFTRQSMDKCANLMWNFPQYKDSCPADLGLGDQRCNVSEPTPTPTRRPSLRPTAWPTQEGVTKRPTRPPTQAPSPAPSRRPSKRPSAQPIAPRPGSPTRRPTVAPTSHTLVTAEYKQSLDGMTVSAFSEDAEAKTAFQETVAGVVGTNASAIVINNATEVSSAASGQRRLGQARHVGIVVDYSIFFSTEDLDTQDVESALSTIGARITASVSDGEFLRSLVERDGGSGLYENVTVSAPSFQGYSVTFFSLPPALAPTAAPTAEESAASALTDSTLFLVALGAGCAFVLVAGLIHCRNRQKGYKLMQSVQVSPRTYDNKKNGN